jgi:hypothetical protein
LAKARQNILVREPLVVHTFSFMVRIYKKIVILLNFFRKTSLKR